MQSRPDIDNSDYSKDILACNGRSVTICIDFEWTPKYCWYLIPTVEINTSIKEVAINIFCLGIYIYFKK